MSWCSAINFTDNCFKKSVIHASVSLVKVPLSNPQFIRFLVWNITDSWFMDFFYYWYGKPGKSEKFVAHAIDTLSKINKTNINLHFLFNFSNHVTFFFLY